MPLMLGAMAACQDNVEELTSATNELAATRTENLAEASDFYWYRGEKIYLRKVQDKSYVMFKSKNANVLISSLAKAKVRLDANKIEKYQYEGTDNMGKAAKNFKDYEWSELRISDKEAYNYPEIEYAAPYYYAEDGSTFPLTNIVYVVLKEKGDLPILEKMATKYNVEIFGRFQGRQELYALACTKDSKGNALEIANIFYESELFHIAEPAFISGKPQTADPYYSQQWYLKNTGQYGSSYAGYDINFEPALSLMPSTSSVTVAVVDNGIKLDHTDLLLSSTNYNTVTPANPSAVQNTTANPNHGTWVAGVISAKTGNNVGIAGIASTAGVDVMSISFQYGHQFFIAHAADGIEKAADLGADVINLSWTTTTSSVISDAIDYALETGRLGKGCVVVASAGNSNTNTAAISFPSNYTGVISAGAISYDGIRKTASSPDGESWYSNYGSGLDIVAPGVKIRTTTAGGSYSTIAGTSTSFAAAQVSAVAALVLAKSYYLSYEDVAYIVEKTANKTIPGFTSTSTKEYGTWSTYVGYGLLDTYAALSMAASTTSSGSLSISGATSLTADSNGYAGTTLTASPSNSNYTYIWSGVFYGSCNSWSISPSGGYGHGSSASVSVYLGPSDTGGTLLVTCRAYNGTTYIGSYTHYLNVSP